MTHPVLVLGIGNVLMSDDGAGVHAALGFDPLDDQDLKVLDGGTLGLSLLTEVESCGALIVFDAASFGAAPGVGADLHRRGHGRSAFRQEKDRA